MKANPKINEKQQQQKNRNKCTVVKVTEIALKYITRQMKSNCENIKKCSDFIFQELEVFICNYSIKEHIL